MSSDNGGFRLFDARQNKPRDPSRESRRNGVTSERSVARRREKERERNAAFSIYVKNYRVNKKRLMRRIRECILRRASFKDDSWLVWILGVVDVSCRMPFAVRFFFLLRWHYLAMYCIAIRVCSGAW